MGSNSELYDSARALLLHNLLSFRNPENQSYEDKSDNEPDLSPSRKHSRVTLHEGEPDLSPPSKQARLAITNKGKIGNPLKPKTKGRPKTITESGFIVVDQMKRSLITCSICGLRGQHNKQTCPNKKNPLADGSNSSNFASV